MTNTTNTTTAAKKQYTFGVSESHKAIFGEFRSEFTRPAAVAKAPPVSMSEKELLEVLYKVATDRRFVTRPVMESVEVDGENVEVQSHDEDGFPKFETIDLFEIEWEKIKAREYSESVSKTPTVAGLVASIRNYAKKLGLSEEKIQAMISQAEMSASMEA